MTTFTPEHLSILQAIHTCLGKADAPAEMRNQAYLRRLSVSCFQTLQYFKAMELLDKPLDTPEWQQVLALVTLIHETIEPNKEDHEDEQTDWLDDERPLSARV